MTTNKNAPAPADTTPAHKRAEDHDVDGDWEAEVLNAFGLPCGILHEKYDPPKE